MTINVNPNESPNEGRDNSNEVNSSEVPVYQLMDGFDEDIDQNDNTSDDSVEDNYELLSQDLNESNDQMTYYEHNVVVDWIDVQNETNSHSNSDTNEDINSIDTKTNESITNNDSNEEMFVTNNDLVERRLSLSDDRINEIKGLMSGFELPNDCIPVWAQNIPEDQWKQFLLKKLEDTN